MTIVSTFVCTRCHSGWTVDEMTTRQVCPDCGRDAEHRGGYFVLDLSRSSPRPNDGSVATTKGEV